MAGAASGAFSGFVAIQAAVAAYLQIIAALKLAAEAGAIGAISELSSRQCLPGVFCDPCRSGLPFLALPQALVLVEQPAFSKAQAPSTLPPVRAQPSARSPRLVRRSVWCGILRGIPAIKKGWCYVGRLTNVKADRLISIPREDRTEMRALSALALALAVGCGRDRAHDAVRRHTLDPRLVYAAALGDSGGPVAPRQAALGLDLMTDSGTYRSSGRLPQVVSEYLRSRGLVSEVCAVSDSTHGVPRCIAQHARVDIRFSRIILVSPDTVRVFVGGRSIQPVAEPRTELFIPFASTELITLVWHDGRWRVVARQTTMIT